MLGVTSSTPFTVRRLRPGEVALAVEWAAREGWNPGLRDAECLVRADPDGFFVGELADEPVATISAVRYGSTYAFVGCYIVEPAYRGRGFGLRTWDVALATVEGRTVGLDGVVAQQHNYARSGFVLAHRNGRFAGTGLEDGSTSSSATLVAASSVPWSRLEAYDAEMFGTDRAGFIRSWIEQPEAVSLVAMSDGRLSGYGVMRPCRTGFKIGPLFADDRASAEALLVALRARAGADAPVFVDVPLSNDAAVAMATSHGMEVVFETARMYRGPAPDVPVERIFGVTSFELG